MSTYQIALLLHLTGAILYFSGLAVAAVALVAARRREHPAEIALLLRLSPYGVIAVLAGSAMLLGFGFWLVEAAGHDFGEAWLSASLTLFVVAVVLGTLGGRKLKQARHLAASIAAEGESHATLELRGLLTDPVAGVLNRVAGLASLAVFVLMVWRPGT